MNEKLMMASEIKSLGGKSIKIKKQIGSNERYDAFLVDYNGEEKILKWLSDSIIRRDPDGLYRNLHQYGGPLGKEFLWVIDVTERKDGRFGYITNSIPDNYFPVYDYLIKNVRFKSYKTIIDASLNILTAFRVLHNEGLFYGVIDDKNIFINPENGDILIDEYDFITNDPSKSDFIYNPRFCAPEIVTNWRSPNALSDRYSVTVILFMLFCGNHPLEGIKSLKPLTAELQENLYGYRPVFIMDPEDDSNRPDPIVHLNVLHTWPYLPNYMKQMFYDSFSKESFVKANKRPTEIEWIKALLRFRNEITSCSCGNEIFIDENNTCECEICAAKIRVPYKLVFNGSSMPVLKGNQIYSCQVVVCNENNSLNSIGIIVSNKDNSSLLGVKNISNIDWIGITPSGREKTISPGDIIPLKNGITFDIGGQKIKIEETV